MRTKRVTNFIICLLTLILISSCKSRSIYGIYEYKKEGYRIVLYPDSLYWYSGVSERKGYESWGKWKYLDKNTVSLLSTFRYDSLNSYVSEKYDSTATTTKIILSDIPHRLYKFDNFSTFVIINDSLKLVGKDSVFLIPDIPVMSFEAGLVCHSYYSYVPDGTLKSQKYQIGNTRNNLLVVRLPLKELPQWIFIEENHRELYLRGMHKKRKYRFPNKPILLSKSI